MAVGPATHASGGVSTIGQLATDSHKNAFTRMHDTKVARTKVTDPNSHSFGGASALGQTNIPKQKNAYTGRGYQVSHSFGGAAGLGQSVDPTIKP